MKRIIVLSLLIIMAFVDVGLAAKTVKKSKSGICHCPKGQYYKRTKKFKRFQTIEACLASGGRHPKRGQGECPKKEDN